MHRPLRSLDEMVDEMVDGPDPQLPYWAHLWPPAVGLAERLLSEAPLEGRAVELGCGIGLAGLAAVAAGLDVTQTDREPAALDLARRSADATGLRPTRICLLDVKGEIWASIDYEKELRQYTKIARCTVKKKPFWAPARAKATPPRDF